jgi:hypothetical protein
MTDTLFPLYDSTEAKQGILRRPPVGEVIADPQPGPRH